MSLRVTAEGLLRKRVEAIGGADKPDREQESGEESEEEAKVVFHGAEVVSDMRPGTDTSFVRFADNFGFAVDFATPVSHAFPR